MENKTGEIDSCLKVDEVAKLLGIAVRTVWQYSKDNVPNFPKPRKFGKVTRWRKSDVSKFISQMGK